MSEELANHNERGEAKQQKKMKGEATKSEKEVTPMKLEEKKKITGH
jgi:hypothetical protein